MFRKKENSLPDVDELVVLERPKPTDNWVVVTPSELLTQYGNVAYALEYYPAELVRDLLLEFFKNKGIKLYAYDEVSAWLTQMKRKAGADYWIWRPLRDKDHVNFSWQSFSAYDCTSKTHHKLDGWYRNSGSENSSYDDLVPLSVLEKVRMLENVFGNTVRFFVSDYASEVPDPFIMVRPSRQSPGNHFSTGYKELSLIFDVWDEPGFEG